MAGQHARGMIPTVCALFIRVTLCAGKLALRRGEIAAVAVYRFLVSVNPRRRKRELAANDSVSSLGWRGTRWRLM
jgi:hypothetical protein